jgi:hypothetical protein
MLSWRSAGKQCEPVGEQIVRVTCYAGYKGEERPMRLYLGERAIEIVETEDRWYEPGATFFRVIVDGGDRYVLRHDEPQDTWRLCAYRGKTSNEALH